MPHYVRVGHDAEARYVYKHVAIQRSFHLYCYRIFLHRTAPNKTPIGYSREEKAEFLDSLFHTLGKVLLISLSKSYLSRDIQNTLF